VVERRASIAITAPPTARTFIPGRSRPAPRRRAGPRGRHPSPAAVGPGVALEPGRPLGRAHDGGHDAPLGPPRDPASVTDAGGIARPTTIVVVVNAGPDGDDRSPRRRRDVRPGDVDASRRHRHRRGGRRSHRPAYRGARASTARFGTGGTIATARLRSGTHVNPCLGHGPRGKRAARGHGAVNAPPMVTITAPLVGATFVPGDAVRLQGTGDGCGGRQPRRGDRWVSDLDGALGAGTDVTSRRSVRDPHDHRTVRDAAARRPSVRRPSS